MKTVVITGGIGSGKSAVCRYLSGLGIPVYDSDSRTRSLYDTDAGLVSSIESALGMKVSYEDGRIDRGLLASVIFSSGDKLQALESVVHPAVLADFIRWRDSCVNVPFVVFESAIILEKPIFHGIADKIILVDAPEGLRLERACARDGADEGRIRERMAKQGYLNSIDVSAPVPGVDAVIVNDGTEEELFMKTDAVIRSWNLM